MRNNTLQLQVTLMLDKHAWKYSGTFDGPNLHCQFLFIKQRQYTHIYIHHYRKRENEREKEGKKVNDEMKENKRVEQ